VLAAWTPDFDVTAASVIPVLLLTTALQVRYFGSLYRLLADREIQSRKQTSSNSQKYRAPSLFRRTVGFMACLSFLGAALAELLALRSLWYRQDDFGWFVFLMIALLLIQTVGGLSLDVLHRLDPGDRANTTNAGGPG
jgi:hypothetical protein